MNYQESIVDRIRQLDDEGTTFRVVINDRRVSDTTPNGHSTNIQDEECDVLSATNNAGLHVRRVKDGAEICWQWHAIGNLRFVMD